jgi:hypothetical protein
MLPEEAQALMAKVLLVVFGTVLLCLSKVRASEQPLNSVHQVIVVEKSLIATKS